jgi:ferritin-like metal-binding protein YciE
MKTEEFEDLFQKTLEELRDAERQIVDSMPKWIASCFSEDLSGALQAHLDETKQQLIRLDSIFEVTGAESSGRECKGMQGLLSEGADASERLERSMVRDIVIITAAQKVEHYEMAAYGSACAIAEMLGQQEVFKILLDILAEEKNASESLAELAKAILSGDTSLQAGARRTRSKN